MEKKEKPVTVHITNHNQFQKGVGAFITNLNHLTLVMDAEGNMKMDMGSVPVMPTAEKKNTDPTPAPPLDGRGTAAPSATSFRFPSEFTRQQVTAAVKAFYHGEHADLALIEATLFDHGQLKKRNAHTAFVKTLAAWGLVIADEAGQKQIISGIKDKYRRLPKEGYEEWGNTLLNDRNRCAEIGRMLGPTMKYQRKTAD